MATGFTDPGPRPSSLWNGGKLSVLQGLSGPQCLFQWPLHTGAVGLDSPELCILGVGGAVRDRRRSWGPREQPSRHRDPAGDNLPTCTPAGLPQQTSAGRGFSRRLLSLPPAPLGRQKPAPSGGVTHTWRQ